MSKRQLLIEVSGVFAILKTKDDMLILANIKTDGDTDKKNYPTIACYNSARVLVADLINLCIQRGIYLNTLTSYSAMLNEAQRVADCCRWALLPPAHHVEAQPCRI